MSWRIRVPEFIEHTSVLGSSENGLEPLSYYRSLSLPGLLALYQARTLDYYAHFEAYGDLSRVVDPGQDPQAYTTGTDEDREKWPHAARQKVLWDRCSLCCGEILRRMRYLHSHSLESLKEVVGKLYSLTAESNLLEAECGVVKEPALGDFPMRKGSEHVEGPSSART